MKEPGAPAPQGRALGLRVGIGLLLGLVVYALLGMWGDVGQMRLALADFNPLLARVYVPSKEFKKLKADQIVELVLDSDKARLRGRITLVSPVIDPNTGTIKITVEVPDYPENTRPGDFVEVQIVTEQHPSSTLVTKTAVIQDRGDRVIYIARGEMAERRVVEVGFTDDMHAEILDDGIDPGDMVVIKGQRSLKHGSVIKVLEVHKPQVTTTPGNLGS